jgi:hypothetical protein
VQAQTLLSHPLIAGPVIGCVGGAMSPHASPCQSFVAAEATRLRLCPTKCSGRFAHRKECFGLQRLTQAESGLVFESVQDWTDE